MKLFFQSLYPVFKIKLSIYYSVLFESFKMNNNSLGVIRNEGTFNKILKKKKP